MTSVHRTGKSRFFTTMLLVSPIVGLYNISTTVFTLGDLAIFLSLLLVLTRSLFEKKLRICTELLPYYLYIILHLLFSLLLRRINDPTDFIGSTLRYLLILTPLIFFAKQYFDIEYGIKFYKYICIFSTVFLIIQTIVVRVFGHYIQGYLEISFLPINRSDLYGLGESLSPYEIFRPRSIFSEPAHYATFIIGYLAISLFKIGKKELPLQLFLSLGLLLSMSSTGILLMIGAWLMFIAVKLRSGTSLRNIILVIPCILLIVLLVMRSEFFQIFLYRFLETTSTQNRFQGYESIKRSFQGNPWLFLFGFGNGGIKYADFLAGYGRLIVYYGLSGMIIFASNMVSLYLKSEKWQKSVLIILFLLQIGGESFFSNLILCQLPFIICNMRFYNVRQNEVVEDSSAKGQRQLK